jgi:hypothetical protein
MVVINGKQKNIDINDNNNKTCDAKLFIIFLPIIISIAF